MDDIPGLYSTCLRKVALMSKEGIWNSNTENNPFCFLPAKIVDNLMSTALLIQKLDGFKADELKLLLTSGKLQEFKFHPKIGTDAFDSDQLKEKFIEHEQEIVRALKYLTPFSLNLEVLHVFGTFEGFYQRGSLRYHTLKEVSKALEELLRNSPNLKHVHCKVKFDLKVLRNCKKLRSIMLHFIPKQPWYDFLEKVKGNKSGHQPLNSLEIFTICSRDNAGPPLVESNYIEVLLRHCPLLTSLGNLETSKALAKLHRTSILPKVNLRYCCWEDGRGDELLPGDDERIQDAIIYHPSVEELNFSIHYVKNIAHLSTLRNLVFLSIWTYVETDISVLLNNVLKIIGVQLKYLSLWSFGNPAADISMLLKNCPNLEALQYLTKEDTRYSEPHISVLNLKYLTLTGENKAEQGLFRLFSDCHNLTELFMIEYDFDDDTLNQFLQKNSLTNLKVAYFEGCDLTKWGYKKFLLNAPNLEKIETISSHSDRENCESDLMSALLETNHKAIYVAFQVTNDDDFFHKKTHCNFK